MPIMLRSVSRMIVALAIVAGSGWHAPVAARQGSTAVSMVTLEWVGSGHPRARQGAIVTLQVQISDPGPEAIRGITFWTGMADNFNFVSAACEGVASSVPWAPCPDIQPGESVSGTIVVQVIGLEGDSRNDAWVWVSVGTGSCDPHIQDCPTARERIQMIGPFSPKH